LRGERRLLSEAEISSTPLSISVLEAGKIQLSGTVSEQSNKIRAEEILMKIKGIKSIGNQIKVVLHYSGNV